MFNPSQADVRRFLCAVHAKTLSGAPMEAIETLASLWIAEHPEYHAELADADAAVARNYDETPEQTNPFLHLSMHLSISEQCSIDQPRGIRQAVELLTARLDSLHDATTPPWTAWAKCCGKASAPAAPPMETPTSPACSAAPPGTEAVANAALIAAQAPPQVLGAWALKR
jgi:Domain of unknown function (DUF1841).